MRRIGAIIAKGREAKGMTQHELAERVGARSQSVSRYETGSSLPDARLLASIIVVLDLETDEALLSWAYEKVPLRSANGETLTHAARGFDRDVADALGADALPAREHPKKRSAPRRKQAPRE